MENCPRFACLKNRKMHWQPGLCSLYFNTYFFIILFRVYKVGLAFTRAIGSMSNVVSYVLRAVNDKEENTWETEQFLLFKLLAVDFI